MARVPGWTVLSSVLAPMFLVGGWTVAAALQPSGFSSARDTISALAGVGATDRAVMTIALAGVGLCHLVTALGLRPAARPGRIGLAVGGAAVLAVAAFPLPVAGTSTPHQLAAGLSFVALAVWPALGWRRGPGVPAVLRAPVGILAAAVLLGLDGWFAHELSRGTTLGLAERGAAGAQALWPLVLVLALRRGQWGPRSGTPDRPGVTHEISDGAREQQQIGGQDQQHGGR